MSKKILALMSFVLVLGLAANASAGLVAHWKLDEGSGTTAVDATGNGHDGTLIGDPQWVVGYSDGGLQFAGSPDKVDIPHSPDLNPENEFTVSVWANLDPAGSGHRSPVTSRDDGPQRGYIIYCTPANTWQFWTGTGSGWDSAGSPAVALGEWTHVAATYSGGAKKLYINGELAGESTTTMPPNTAQVLRIGAGATEGDGNYFFVGTIDDVRIYDHALTEAEIAKLAARVRAEQPNPVDGARSE
ncbi:MAG: LamG domain-containing protein, partial [Planctomycetota bacterium]